ncbi:hypothetical protein [Nocardioides sp. zg-1228]|uniref:hypothetical protein n=1 Tax=Nocardioides sp. zg-1228 TaxID=2763008 RepID=UPI001642A7A1|nr:hypothetical protein [Nocardioides sp. zg-1228]MBC2931867.1 hypothetical protein [Nocardioides sp. zg-1228]QSF57432.1 hypothetical protein JX575_18150 [Nocardioides sp. zg-1228]
MKHDRDSRPVDLTGRIESLEHVTGWLVARRESEAADADVIPIREASRVRVPVPRRSRVYLRGAGAHGSFAELTLTAPVPRRPAD